MRKFVSFKSILLVSSITFCYLSLSVYFMNPILIGNTLLGSYSLSFKLQLVTALFEGMWTAMPHSSLFLLLLTGILTGLNIVLLSQKVKLHGGIRQTRLIIGGSSLLGIAGAGCSTCGLPLLPLFGLTGSFAFLPFHGQEILVISVGLLSFSLYSLKKTLQPTPSCQRVLMS